MIPFFICLIAVLLDRYLTVPSGWQPKTVFDYWLGWVESFCYGDDELVEYQRRRRGMLALAVTVLPLVWVAGVLSLLGPLGLIFDVLILYLALATTCLVRDARAVIEPLRRFEVEEARRRVARITTRDTLELDEQAISVAAIESVLKNGNNVLFAVLFWYLVLGASGVVMVRSVNLLAVMWGQRNHRYRDFGWAAARLDAVLSWLPARLTALTYTLLGNKQRAWRCWQKKAVNWQSANDDTLIAAGAGALGLSVGGEVYYNGELLKRPQLGEGPAPKPHDIARALTFIQHGQWWWLGLIFLLSML